MSASKTIVGGEQSVVPDFDESAVRAWAAAFHARTGGWPTWQSGPIPEAPGETWFTVAGALATGQRGFPPGGSLDRFVDKHFPRMIQSGTGFSVERILEWADAWHAATGRLPHSRAGEIPNTGGVRWRMVDAALRTGLGYTREPVPLLQLLIDANRPLARAPVTHTQIVFWAKAHHARTGEWPRADSGAIPEAPGETWQGINSALRDGSRCLHNSSSLARLLRRVRRAATFAHALRSQGPDGSLPRPPAGGPLFVDDILNWVSAYRARTGRWPNTRSGPIPELPGETWRSVEMALKGGTRGLPNGWSLRLLRARLEMMRKRA
jgi:hypothetical protein